MKQKKIFKVSTGHRLTGLIVFLLVIFLVLPSNAAESMEEAESEIDARKALPVTSDSWEGWPQAPVNAAESAIVMDMDTGSVVYAKNIDTRQFPASITKIMTALIVMEKCELTERVRFSHNAVFSIERGSSNVGIDENEVLTVEECLYCMLLASANEVSNALAEHAAGTNAEFAVLMNEKAKELGCTNTNFTNASGLHDENQYTSALDMALISRAFYSNEVLRRITGSVKYDVAATDSQPDSFEIQNHHRMLPGSLLGTRNIYEYATGGKTGYTTAAQTTLVTFAEKEGMRLVCVILKESGSRLHYTDTAALFDYVFDDFEQVNFSSAVPDEVLNRIGINRMALDTANMVTVPKGYDFSGLSFDIVSEDADYLMCRNNEVVLDKVRINITEEEKRRFFGNAGQVSIVENTGDSVNTVGTANSENSVEYQSLIPEEKDAGDEDSSEKKQNAPVNDKKVSGDFDYLRLGILIFVVVIIVGLTVGRLVMISRAKELARKKKRQEIMDRARKRRKQIELEMRALGEEY